LLEASREKMTRPNTSSAERASVSRNFLEPEEFIKVLEETDELVFRAMLWVHVTTGCRVGTKEADYGRGRGGVLGLSWDNVNWGERTIDVYETKTKGGLTWVDCPLDLFGDECHSALHEYWENAGRPEKGQIFPIKYRSYSGFFKDVVSHVVGRDLRPRVLRNTHATWLLNMGVKVEFIIGTVSRRLREGYALGVGWMEPRMFFEHYARILRRAKREEIIKAQESFRELTIV
jgi:integrase